MLANLFRCCSGFNNSKLASPSFSLRKKLRDNAPSNRLGSGYTFMVFNVENQVGLEESYKVDFETTLSTSNASVKSGWAGWVLISTS